MSSATERLQKLGFNKTSDVVINGTHYNTGSEPKVALAGERAKTSFDIREMTYFLNNGKRKAEKFESFMEVIERDPVFRNDDMYDKDLAATREISMTKVGKIAQYVSSARSEEDVRMRMSVISLADPGSYTRCGVHYGLFLSGVRGSGTDEQLMYWVQQGAYHLKNFAGCFGMTELGHGSNVAGVETTATFDQTNDEFVINTPHVAATKWWIGGAAHTATHCLVYARLIVKGKDYGVKNFVVPLRNVNDHTLLPGIAVGDIGKKMGRDAIDNGWIQFSNARIPRQFMCMRYDKVDRQGNVTQPPLAQLSYGALVGGRVSMVEDSFQTSKRFLTIALRYAACRRQFSANDGAETKLIDYRYHQRRLIPRLAYTYAMQAVSEVVSSVHSETVNTLANANSSNDKALLNVAIADMKELFGLSAGLKAFSTWATAETIDECRQACGGQGYSAYNGFGPGYNDWVVQCTWEGDNNVLTLSTGRSLIQTFNHVLKGKQPGSVTEYLTRAKTLAKATLGLKDIRQPEVLIEAWESAASRIVGYATAQFNDLVEKGTSATEAFEELSQLRFEAARIHTRLFVVKSFYEKIKKSAVDSIRAVLLDLATLFGLWSIEKDIAFFLKSGYLTTSDTDVVTRYVDDYCLKIREQAIGLTDAFNLSDYFLNSVIGRYDGDVYNNILNNAKAKDQNLRNNSKPPYYDSVMRPILARKSPPEPDVDQFGDDL